MRKIDFQSPPKRKRTVVLRTIGGWCTNLVFVFQGFLFIPLYLEFLGERLYGFWLATGGLVAWLAMADIGTSLVTQQRTAAAYGRGELKVAVNYFWHGGIVVSGVVSIVAIGLYVLSLFLNDVVRVDPQYQEAIQYCFIISGLSLVFRLLNEFMQSFANGLQRGHYGVFAQAASNMMGLFFIYIFLVHFQWGIWSLAWAALIRSLLLFAFNAANTTWMLYSISEKCTWSKALLKDYLVTTPAVLFSKSSGQLAASLPVLLITRYVSPEATVAYTVTMRVAQILFGFINHGISSVYSASAHFVSDPLVSAEKVRTTIGKFSRSFCVISFITLGLYVVLNHGFVRLWTSEAQFAGQIVTTLIALAGFLSQSSNLFVGVIGSTGVIRDVELTKGFENLLKIGLIFFLVQSMGVVGAPLAVVIGSIIMQPVFWRVVVRTHADLAVGLKPLFWLWVPLGAGLFGLSLLAEWFTLETWLSFIFWSALLSLPFAALFVYGVDGVRARLISMAQQFGLFSRRSEI